MSDREEIIWDGTIHSYRPPANIRELVPAGMFHEDTDENLDSVAYEVIRNRLWTINTAHGEMVTRISGSPIFQGLDFNMCILTEDGEVVMNAPYIQYLDSGAPLAIPYILQHHIDDPGIQEGDIYICNDPWIGAVHQMDVFFGMPVFIDGKIFAWVSNAGHQYDLGGVAAGGWPENAVDVFHDPVVMPPFKLVEAGHMRKDLEAVYLRHSRFPGLVALDLRAQIAGCRFAAEQLKQACTEFGAGTVKSAMRRVLDSAQESFRTKLLRIPDGRWSQVLYFDEKLPGDRHSQRVQLNIEKKGDRLKVDNIGTEPQSEGPNGMTYVAFTGTVLGALTLVMLQQQMFALGGAARQVDFEPEPGLLTCVDHPSAVSGGVLNVIALLHGTMALLAKMLACDPDQAGDAVVPGTDIAMAVISGADDRDRAFGSAFIEHPGGAGATSWRDGVDNGGFVFAPLLQYRNAEEQEGFYPVVILWRKQLIDSGAAGRWRGGGGVHFGAMEYRSTSISMSTNTGAMAVSGYGAPSVMGAYPLPTVRYRLAKGTNVYELFKAHHMPTDIDEIDAEDMQLLRGKSTGNAIEHGDVVSIRFAGGGGYGDPLLREPERVGYDVLEGWVSVEAAAGVYGVCVDAAGNVDAEATAARREEILAQRARWQPVDGAGTLNAGVATTPSTGMPTQPVHSCVVATDLDGERVLACSNCGDRLAPYQGNFRAGLLVERTSVTEIPLVEDPTYYLDDAIEFRRYCCPGCQTLMCTEVVKVDEPHTADMIFAPPA